MKAKFAILLLVTVLMILTATNSLAADKAAATKASAKVYMTKDISPAGLQKVYESLERPATGNKVAIKLTVGEPGNNYYLAPALIRDLVQSVNGTFIDGNTAYTSQRNNTEGHLQAAIDHGFTAVAPMDVLDSEGEITLPVIGGIRLREVLVGSHFSDYDFIVVLTHFKGHAMGGFGGALKNIAIGMASKSGKALVHTAGNSTTNPFDGPHTQEAFLESMAEAASGMIRAMGPKNMLYISVMNNLSIDCDCASNPSAPEIHDIGILASLDPVALDRACVDLIYAADDAQSASLRERMEAKSGVHLLTHAEQMGIGSQAYTLVLLDD